MKIIGIHDGHDASVALCDESGILFSLAEERVSRIKHHYGFPVSALENLLSATQINSNEIEALAFTGQSYWFPEHKNTLISYISTA